MALRGRNNLTDERFFFVTTTIKNFSEVFVNDGYCEILIHNIKHYQKKYGFEILAYVIMPTHFHWIIKMEQSKGTIPDIMRDIKKYSAWDILEKLRNDKRDLSLFKSNVLGQKMQLWMHRFDDKVIRDQSMLCNTVRYIHNNPVEKGLVEKPEDYKYSSAMNYFNGDHSVIYVDTGWAPIEMLS